MELLSKIISEEDSTISAEKILSKVKDKIKEQIGEAFYTETEGWLNELFINANDKIKKDLIKTITDEFVRDPANFQFKDLRDKLIEEHGNKITPALTDKMILDSMQKLILEHTNKGYIFHWMWKDGIVKLILQNWDQFKDDERIMAQFGRKIQQQADFINALENKLRIIESEINDQI